MPPAPPIPMTLAPWVRLWHNRALWADGCQEDRMPPTTLASLAPPIPMYPAPWVRHWCHQRLWADSGDTAMATTDVPWEALEGQWAATFVTTRDMDFALPITRCRRFPQGFWVIERPDELLHVGVIVDSLVGDRYMSEIRHLLRLYGTVISVGAPRKIHLDPPQALADRPDYPDRTQPPDFDPDPEPAIPDAALRQRREIRSYDDDLSEFVDSDDLLYCSTCGTHH